MKKIIFIATILFCLLLVGMSWPGIPVVMEVYFAEGTTYKEASEIMNAQKGVNVEGMYIWQYKNDVDVWSGGVGPWTDKQTIADIRSLHWFQYYDTVDHALNSVSKRIGQSGAASAAQYDSLLAEKARLDQGIVGCWKDDTCPEVLVHKVEVIVTDSETVSQVLALPIVNQAVEIKDDDFFFRVVQMMGKKLLDSLHRIGLIT
ncbi:MAG: hypothetical protein AAF702_14030 [Chloroflexota bacterium]